MFTYLSVLLLWGIPYNSVIYNVIYEILSSVSWESWTGMICGKLFKYIFTDCQDGQMM